MVMEFGDGEVIGDLILEALLEGGGIAGAKDKLAH